MRITNIVSEIYNIPWPHMLGNCHLNRPTDEYLMKAGDWEKVNFLKYKEEKDFEVVPHICGRLVKPR